MFFIFLESFQLVYKQWGFNSATTGLAFLPILVGYFLAWALFIPAIKRNIRERKAKPDDEHAQFESRLWPLLWLVPCLPIGLIGFAWTSLGPPIHWFGTMVFSCLIGVGNYAIYVSNLPTVNVTGFVC